MIAPGTDPAWTPLFLAACAVVVDVGAPLSHAAIVSRELGVPCVVSATNASRRIPDGATVHVDGGTRAGDGRLARRMMGRADCPGGKKGDPR